MDWSLVYLPFVAFISALVLLPLVRKFARRLGFVDNPGGRKQHHKAIPPIGGLVIFSLFLLISTQIMNDSGALWFMAALLLLVVMGGWDDRYGVPAFIKFAGQFMAALFVVVFGHARIYFLGDMFGLGEMWTGFAGIPFTLAAVMLLINAINLIDGLDGLAAGVSLIGLSWLVVPALIVGGASGFALGPLVLIGLILAFLVYNMRSPWRRSASIFLGDAGSLALGLSLSWYAIVVSQRPYFLIEPIAVAWVLALPVFDTCAQFARRVSLGRHPFDADHYHFHHHLIYVGFQPGQATALILGIVALCGAVGVVGSGLGVPTFILTLLWCAGLLGHMYLSIRPTRYRKLIRALVRYIPRVS